METEKNILTEVSYTSMESQGNSEGEKLSLDAFLERNELDLERRVGESEKDYHERLLAIQATQVGLIFSYEEEKDLERMRKVKCDFESLLERGNIQDEVNAINAILTLYKDVVQYFRNYPHFNCKEKVQEKLMDLKSLT